MMNNHTISAKQIDFILISKQIKTVTEIQTKYEIEAKLCSFIKIFHQVLVLVLFIFYFKHTRAAKSEKKEILLCNKILLDTRNITVQLAFENLGHDCWRGRQ